MMNDDDIIYKLVRAVGIDCRHRIADTCTIFDDSLIRDIFMNDNCLYSNST